LSTVTIAGTAGAVPAEGAFTATFWIAAGAGLLGAVGMVMVPRRGRATIALVRPRPDGA
ncbi:MAG: hypothetical protein QOK40_3218, partial [Miltoncostaeaceae bacterium]|nr:hypothetical protein [Miltoncostaeaceae bacterium]